VHRGKSIDSAHDGGMRPPVAPSTFWNAGGVLMVTIGVIHDPLNR